VFARCQCQSLQRFVLSDHCFLCLVICSIVVRCGDAVYRALDWGPVACRRRQCCEQAVSLRAPDQAQQRHKSTASSAPHLITRPSAAVPSTAPSPRPASCEGFEVTGLVVWWTWVLLDDALRYRWCRRPSAQQLRDELPAANSNLLYVAAYNVELYLSTMWSYDAWFALEKWQANG